MRNVIDLEQLKTCESAAELRRGLRKLLACKVISCSLLADDTIRGVMGAFAVAVVLGAIEEHELGAVADFFDGNAHDPWWESECKE